MSVKWSTFFTTPGVAGFGLYSALLAEAAPSCLPRSVVAPSLDDTVNYSRLNIQLSPTNIYSAASTMETVGQVEAEADPLLAVIRLGHFGALEDERVLQRLHHHEVEGEDGLGGPVTGDLLSSLPSAFSSDTCRR
ncbi:hypothetical protein TYRP_023724 [Tyrophagus putrescentiae]|nr:hypothetical protein TYRP_023724 [Tyrophagus putrescentiae]